MRYTVQVKPNARKPSVKMISAGELSVSVDAPAQEGKANKRLIELLSEHFGVAKSRVSVVKGEHGKRKIVEIDLNA